MFGPATGHNIKPFLNFFSNSKNNNYQLSFFYSGKINSENKDLNNISFYKLSKSLASTIRLKKELKKANVIWHQGGYNILELLFILLFKQKKALFVINIWGEHVPKIASTDTIKGKIYKYFYKKCDVISCLWYGTKNILDKFVDPDKVKVLRWGLESTYFSDKEQPLQDFTKKFIAQIPKGKKIFFYPKSFTEASNHDGIIEAARVLQSKGTTNFLVYFWTGNITRGDFENNAKKKIEAYGLENNVRIIYHDFLPFYDIISIWKCVDVGLQIVKNDQLSTTFLEPLILKKEIMVSNIYPYQKMNEYYPDLDLFLVTNTANAIAQRMEDFIDGNLTPERILENRKKIIEDNFNFEENIQKMVDYYQQLLKEKKS